MNKILVTLVIFILYSQCAWSTIHYKDASTDATAQKLFDKGMLNYYGYLYAQAEFDFRQALLYDPSCGICYWGLAITKKQEALELGLPFATIGFADIEKAIRLIPRSHAFQYDAAQAARSSFSLDPRLSSKKLQLDYINALRMLYQKYRNDSEWREESLALFVDAIAYYSNVDDGLGANHCSRSINEDYRKEAVNLIKPVLKDETYSDHPGLLHTYIHLTERDLNDPMGIVAADKLPSFAHDLIAHYAHMPNHIYWRRGMYAQAIQANRNAIAIDLNYFKQGGAGLNSYYYEYHYLHSYHFLAALGTLTNNPALALENARAVKNLMDVSRIAILKDYRDTFFSLEHLVLARFNRWHDVLELKTPQQTEELGLLFIDFSKALAYLHLGEKAKYKTLFTQLKNKHYTRKNISEIQTLVLNYLKASEMGMQHSSLKEIESLFVKKHSDQIESKLFILNPPIWYFPFHLLLSDIAVSRGDSVSARKYHDLYEQMYPGSTLGSLNNPMK